MDEGAVKHPRLFYIKIKGEDKNNANTHSNIKR